LAGAASNMVLQSGTAGPISRDMQSDVFSAGESGTRAAARAAGSGTEEKGVIEAPKRTACIV
jgi:hypothetical protein